MDPRHGAGNTCAVRVHQGQIEVYCRKCEVILETARGFGLFDLNHIQNNHERQCPAHERAPD